MQRTISREIISVIIKVAAVIVTIILILVTLPAFYEVETAISDGRCNIAVLPIEGSILPFHGLVERPLVVTPDKISNFLDRAERQPEIEGVLLEINSPGGMPVASERIAERLRNSDLPIIGLIGDFGTSGGYMVAAATDQLYASAMSNVGSIGVNASYLEESQKNEEEGVNYVQLIAGEYKDAGSPNRPLSAEERELIERDLDIVHDHFIDLISEYRDLPREEVVELADGSTMTGERAVEAGLVDRIGGRNEVRDKFSLLLGKDLHEVEFCEYQTPLLPF